jgi:hypothetical protein
VVIASYPTNQYVSNSTNEFSAPAQIQHTSKYFGMNFGTTVANMKTQVCMARRYEYPIAQAKGLEQTSLPL